VSDADSFKLDELAHAAGTSPRTVRYYVQRGLLPGPNFRGKDTAYTREHLVRLRAIRRLPERFLPLDAIQVELARLGPDELERLADGKHVTLSTPTADTPAAPPAQVPSVPPSSAGAYPPTSTTFLRFTRRELAPGLELTLADDAPPEARALAEEIRIFTESLVRQRGAKR
jgi:DNA-binding transcriptional MerR regulator